MDSETMQSFKDTNGLSWDFKFTRFLRGVIMSRCGVDIAKLLTKDTVKQIDADPDNVCHVLWACIEKQAESRKVDFETFFTSHVDEDLMGELVEKLFDEAVEYAPKKSRPAMEKLRNLYRQSEEEIYPTLMKHIDDISIDDVVSAAKNGIENLLQKKSPNGKIDSSLESVSQETS